MLLLALFAKQSKKATAPAVAFLYLSCKLILQKEINFYLCRGSLIVDDVEEGSIATTTAKAKRGCDEAHPLQTLKAKAINKLSDKLKKLTPAQIAELDKLVDGL